MASYPTQKTDDVPVSYMAGKRSGTFSISVANLITFVIAVYAAACEEKIEQKISASLVASIAVCVVNFALLFAITISKSYIADQVMFGIVALLALIPTVLIFRLTCLVLTVSDVTDCASSSFITTMVAVIFSGSITLLSLVGVILVHLKQRRVRLSKPPRHLPNRREAEPMRERGNNAQGMTQSRDVGQQLGKQNYTNNDGCCDVCSECDPCLPFAFA